MILDSHCHVWERWPYQPPVPDPDSRARAGQLLYEMDAYGVDHAVLICARIGDNPRNVDYAVDAALRHAGRFTVFPDLESRWAPDFRTPGAPARFEAALARWDFAGFTMYLDEAESGDWLVSEEGLAVFRLAEARGLLASLSILPHQAPAVGALARAVPALPILLHHFAFLGPRSAATAGAMDLVLALAAAPNIHVKYSGMGNVAAPEQDYPFPDLAPIPARLLAAFGPHRLLWGSDYPVSRRHMTYRQTLRLAERHGPLAPSDLPLVMGANMARLLRRAT